MGYGDSIRQWRSAQGWTQRQLSEKLGCTDSYVTHLESQVKLPSTDICMALAQVFHLTPQEQQALVEEVEAMRRQRARSSVRIAPSARSSSASIALE